MINNISRNSMEIFIDVIKCYIENKSNIDIDKQIKEHKDNNDLLDKTAIFLRILDKYLIDFDIGEYLKNVSKYKDIKGIIEQKI
jgi:hypothetical protein